MITLVIFLVPFVIGLLLIKSDGSVGPIPVKALGYVLVALFGFFLLLLIL